MTEIFLDNFENLIRHYLEEFRTNIGPVSEEVISSLIDSYKTQEDLYAEKVRFILSYVRSNILHALDIGSSAGGLSVALARQGIQVEGIEPSLAGVETSRARAERCGVANVHFRVGVGEKIPFSESSFDFVISLAVLEHVQDVEKVISETYRVLQSGGKAYFEVPNNLYPFEGHYKMVWLPMMPKKFAKIYVKARGYYPEFLDRLHYMNRFVVFRHFRNAGFVNLCDLYPEYIAGKATGANWNMGHAPFKKVPFVHTLCKIFLGPIPTNYFLNRAIFLLATKP